MRMTPALSLILFSSVAFAADEPADAKIGAAITKGVNFLLSNNPANSSSHGIGPTCLAGMALLECDVKHSNAVMASIHSAVRRGAIGEVNTYQVALAILFLDRYGDPNDVALIQVLGARLMAGQTIAAGWGYKTFDEISPADESRVRNAISAAPSPGKMNSEAGRILQMLAQGGRAGASLGGDDNSNTQFGLIGLWVARRHGIPADAAFRRLQSRFLRSQAPGDGGWGYATADPVSSPSMTCAGLLALAAGKAIGEAELQGERPPDGQPKDKPEDDPFEKPPPPGAKGDDENPDAPPAPPVDPNVVALREKAIERGLTALGKLIGNPAALGAATGAYGGLDDLYFMWSLERVGVAFGLDSIGGVDWYKWGCSAILPAQKPDGSWDGKYQSPNTQTAFALLFLKKANFTSDLSRKITGKVKDPGGGELRGGRGAGPQPIKPTGTVQAKAGPDDPKAPGINAVRKTVEAEKIAEGLVAANDRDWPAKLRTAREAKGPLYTLGLAQAIAVLEGKRLYQAREALAERLTRMTGETLKRMLGDRDAEIRRAACLAAAMKEEKSVYPEVIDCITDPNDFVVWAAKAALKAVSNEDRGPAPGASDEEKRKAADDWRFWYATWSRGKN